MAQLKPKLLLVEDNLDNRTLMLDLIQMLAIDVLEAADGDEAVKMAKEHKPDLILMDLSLPNKDGWTATEEIRADQEIGDMKIIALTAHAMTGDKERALKAGCDDYITKPIRSRDLIDKLKHVLDL